MNVLVLRQLIYTVTMTLVLTALLADKIVQVADTKLTLDGEPYDDDAIKAVGVSCDDAYFTIGYSGVAEIKGKRLDYFLIDAIRDGFSSGITSATDVIDEVVRRLEDEIARLRFRGSLVAQQNKGLVFVAGGYGLSEKGQFNVPFAAAVSNISGQTEKNVGQIANTFTVQYYGLDSRQAGNYTPTIILGMRPAIFSKDVHAKKTNQKLKNVTRFLRRIDKQAATSAETSSRLLAEVIQRASKHPSFGKYIGSRCISAVLKPDSEEIPCHYHCEDSPSVIRLPHLVTPMMVASDIEIRTDFDPEEYLSEYD